MTPQPKHLSRQITSLNAPWWLELDPDDLGRQHNWGETPRTAGIEVQVPSCWNQYFPGYEGVAWYFKTFEDKPLEPSEQVFLRFHAVDYYTEVWFDGTFVGEHEGGFTPFILDVTSAWRNTGEHVVAVRVVDPPARTDEAVGGFVHSEIPAGQQALHFNHCGIWQGVDLIRTGPVFLADVYVEPLPGCSEIHVHLEFRTNLTQRVRYRLDILESDRRFVASVSSIIDGVDGVKRDRIRLRVPEPRWWNPDNPLIYIMRCVASIGEVLSDVNEQRFGLREFEMDRTGFVLNGREIYVQGVSDLQFYPVTLAAPQDFDAARRELLLLKKCGYNLVRFQFRPPAPVLLDLCDELGILVLAEPAIGCIKASPKLRERCMNEVREMVQRDRNHPSVVAWGILNEPCPPPEIRDHEDAPRPTSPLREDLCALARQLDPTRLILSGGDDAAADAKNFLNPRRTDSEDYSHHRTVVNPPVSNADATALVSLGEDGDCLWSSGPGGHSLADLQRVVEAYGECETQYEDLVLHREFSVQLSKGWKSHKLKNIVGTIKEVTEQSQRVHGQALVRALLAIRSNPRSAGFCVGNLADFGHHPCGGVADVHMNPKHVIESVADATGPVGISILLQHDQMYVGREIGLKVVFLNDIRRQGTFRLVLRVRNSGNDEVFAHERDVTLTGDRAQTLFDSGVALKKRALGIHTVEAKLEDIAARHAQFTVHAPPPPPDAIEIVDPEDRLPDGLKNSAGDAGILVAPVSNGHVLKIVCKLILPRVRAGKKAVFLSLPVDERLIGSERGWGTEYRWDNDVFDQPLYYSRTGGGIEPYFHYIPKHPIFSGLPQKCMAGPEYADVLSGVSVRADNARIIAGAFRFPLPPYPHLRDVRHAAEFWWGGNLISIPLGDGEVLISTFNIHGRLGHPIADRLLSNLMLYAAGRLD